MADFKENIVKGKSYRICVDADNNEWDKVSLWTSSDDVEMADGQSVEDAVASKQPMLTPGENITIDENGVISASGGGGNANIWYGTQAEWDALDKTEIEDGCQVNISDDPAATYGVIDTMDELKANTQAGKFVDSLVVKEIANSELAIKTITPNFSVGQLNEVVCVANQIGKIVIVHIVCSNVPSTFSVVANGFPIPLNNEAQAMCGNKLYKGLAIINKNGELQMYADTDGATGIRVQLIYLTN